MTGSDDRTATDPNKVDAIKLSLMLADLRLPTINQLWKSFAKHADAEGWTAARFLAALAEHELAERDRRRIERHLREARLLPGTRPNRPTEHREPDRGRHRHRLRPLVESGGGTAGHGPGAPDRPGQARIRSSPDRRKHRRGGHSADAGPQAGPGGRLVRRNGPGSADAHGRGHPCAVRGRMTRVLDWQIEEETARRGPGSARLERRRRRTPAASGSTFQAGRGIRVSWNQGVQDAADDRASLA